MRNAFQTLLLATGTTVAIAAPACAWDYPGHRIVGAIADAVLAAHYPDTSKRVKEMLKTKDKDGNDWQRSLSQVAVFPDCAKTGNVSYCGRTPSEEEKTYAAHNPQHNTFHYTDVPIQQSKYVPYSPGTEPNDVVHMVRYVTLLLADKNPKKRQGVDLTKTEALWLLTHLVGDVHQPLHVGGIYFDKQTCATIVDPNDVPGGMANVVSTNGGNSILLRPPEPNSLAVGPADNLHLFWDGAAVVAAMQAKGLTGSEEAFARALAATVPTGWQTTGAPETWAEQWATEILPLARDALLPLQYAVKKREVIEPGKVSCRWTTTASKSYSDATSDTVSKQLTKAGFRLAALLATLLPK